MTFAFTKMEGLGNDFLVLDARRSGAAPSAEMAVRLCDRHRAVGADGVLTLLPSAQAMARLEIRNADGSTAEMCGNGLRCAARLLAFEGSAELTIETALGVHRCRLLSDGTVWAELLGLQRGIPLELEVAGERWKGHSVSLGNPHLVLFADPARAAQLGPLFEHHPRFAPHRTNVEFAEVSEGGLRVVVWERGVGLTQACGTGAAAAAVAAKAEGLFKDQKEVAVDLPGGRLYVELLPGGREAALRGPARTVFHGEIDLG